MTNKQAYAGLMERVKLIAEEIQERSFDPYDQRARDVWNAAEAISSLLKALEQCRDDLDELYHGPHDSERLSAGILAQKHIIDAALSGEKL